MFCATSESASAAAGQIYIPGDTCRVSTIVGRILGEGEDASAAPAGHVVFSGYHQKLSVEKASFTGWARAHGAATDPSRWSATKIAEFVRALHSPAKRVAQTYLGQFMPAALDAIGWKRGMGDFERLSFEDVDWALAFLYSLLLVHKDDAAPEARDNIARVMQSTELLDEIDWVGTEMNDATEEKSLKLMLWALNVDRIDSLPEVEGVATLEEFRDHLFARKSHPIVWAKIDTGYVVAVCILGAGYGRQFFVQRGSDWTSENHQMIPIRDVPIRGNYLLRSPTTEARDGDAIPRHAAGSDNPLVLLTLRRLVCEGRAWRLGQYGERRELSLYSPSAPPRTKAARAT